MNEKHDQLRASLLRQLDMAWRLMGLHLDGLGTEECLWRPASTGPHIHRDANDVWIADWPEHERYDLGPASIAWLIWHAGFWWSMALDHSFGEGTLQREAVAWPGSADGVRLWLGRLHSAWRIAVERLEPDELQSADRTRWPFAARPFADVVAWVNVELTKSAAEIGYVRFLYATRER
ncbi:MAG TPA: DinB family protein [Gemmatimonadaceae bacterium]|nr:DinB family protein [Gemmatimonadaceae bacterium]